MSPEISVIADAKTLLAESPVWDVETERLYWVGVLDGCIFSARDNGTEIRVWKFPGQVNAFGLRSPGGAIIASGTSFHLFDFATGEAECFYDPQVGSSMNANDGKADRNGRFVIGLSDRELARVETFDRVGTIQPAGGYYLVEPDLSVELLADDFGVTNGPCFSPDGSTLYCGDSWARRIYAYDYDAEQGTVGSRRLFTEVEGGGTPDEPTRPDGATVDEEGYLWLAAVYAGEVRRYAPDGTLDRRIPVPVAKPTSVAFGGPGLDVLYVTSMAHRGSAFDPGVEAVPLAGSLFAISRLGVRGTPEPKFAR